MRYLKFIIKGYRGISDLTEINITKESLIPIIGKNESGKTTCLEAINAFDFSNDNQNEGKHLNNVENLYSTLETPIIVGAEIEVDQSFNFLDVFNSYSSALKSEFVEKYPKEVFDISTISLTEGEFVNTDILTAYQLLVDDISNNKKIIIERDIKTRQYSLPVLKEIISGDLMNALGEKFVKELPYILYFDDFRDRMAEKVYVIADEANPLYSYWISYVDELFKQTKKEYSVFTLNDKQDSIRRSIVTEVQKKLNLILTQEWAKYQFDNKESIQVKIEYLNIGQGPFLQFKIVENVYVDGMLEERYFDISDRSKGFYWYFNFMMKLHFNPSKRETNDVDTIYLLDEPGSYLHTYALDKLAEQLKRLSENNKVIFCTHFHNLLNPEFVPINSIRIAEKINQGKILLKRLDDAELIRPKKNSAYQPILDALEVKPPLLDYGFDDVVLLEGIYDYYSFRMFTSNSLSYFPCVSASSIINQIPYMIFLGKRYLAVWDDDNEGRSRVTKAIELFGDVEGQKFMTLNAIDNLDNTRLEEYYNKIEVNNFNNYLETPNSSLYRTIISLFYLSNRESLIERYFPLTKQSFLEMEITLREKLKSQL